MRRFRRQFQQHQVCWHSEGDSSFAVLMLLTVRHVAQIWLPLSEMTVVQTRLLKETSSVRHSPQSRLVQVI